MLYYYTDQHWNELGALVGYSKMIEVVRKDFPEIKEVTPELVDTIICAKEGDGLAKSILMKEEYEDLYIDVRLKRNTVIKDTALRDYPIPEPFPYKYAHQMRYRSEDDSLPKLLLISDSYANSVLDLIPISFSESTLIWDNWNYKLNRDIINKEQPDILITMIIESNLDYILYKHPNERD